MTRPTPERERSSNPHSNPGAYPPPNQAQREKREQEQAAAEREEFLATDFRRKEVAWKETVEKLEASLQELQGYSAQCAGAVKDSDKREAEATRGAGGLALVTPAPGAWLILLGGHCHGR